MPTLPYGEVGKVTTEPVIEITVGTQTVTLLSVEWQLANGGAPSDTKPDATAGFTVLDASIELDGIRLWVEYRIV